MVITTFASVDVVQDLGTGFPLFLKLCRSPVAILQLQKSKLLLREKMNLSEFLANSFDLPPWAGDCGFR